MKTDQPTSTSRPFHALATLIALLMVNHLASGTDYYVSTSTGMDSPGRGSQALPWKSINYALDHISGSPAGPHRVLVAQGTYSENVVCDPFESIYGGYNPADWTRDLGLYPATIDAAQGGSGVVLAEGCTVDGFTIINGLRDYGGGVYCYNLTNTTIANCLITHCTATGRGSAIYIRGGPVYVVSNSMTYNTNDTLYVDNGDARLQNNLVGDTFPNPLDTSYTGHGIYCNGSTILLLNDRIFRSYRNAIYVYSGSISATQTVVAHHELSGIHIYYGDLNLQDCIFGCNAKGNGLYAEGAIVGAEVSMGVNIKIRRCVFCQNSPLFGSGALSLNVASAAISDSVLVNNRSGAGWGFGFGGGVVSLTNNFMVNNGTLWFGGCGGARWSSVNNTYCDNYGGIRRSCLVSCSGTNINDLIWSNGDDLNLTDAGGNPVAGSQYIRFCDIEDGNLNGTNGNISVVPDFVGQVASGSISARSVDSFNCRSTVTDNAAHFTPNALKGTFLWFNTNAFFVESNTANQIIVYGDLAYAGISAGNPYSVKDYRLMDGSLCMDTGTANGAPSRDFFGNPRPSGLGIDIGAAEVVPPPFTLAVRLTNNLVALDLSGSFGANITIQSTTNLADTNSWTAWTNFTLPFSPYTIMDGGASTVAKYYRAFRLP